MFCDVVGNLSGYVLCLCLCVCFGFLVGLGGSGVWWLVCFLFRLLACDSSLCLGWVFVGCGWLVSLNVCVCSRI